MLCKEVCQRCQEQRRTRGWTDTKEANWSKKGRIWCVGKDDSRCKRYGLGTGPIVNRISPWHSTEAEPPTQCYYLMEHQILGQGNLNG